MSRIANIGLVLLAVVASASAAGGAPSAHRHARLDPLLAAARAGEPVQALVVLAQQAPLRRHWSREAVERELRDTARIGQGPLLQLLASRRSGGRVGAVTPLWIFNGILVTATPDVLGELAARPDVLEVRMSRTIRASDALAAAPPEPNVSLVNAPALWSLGDRGEGVVVASLDTGVDGTHPDLASAWRGGTNSWYDPYAQHVTAPTDVNGHGTWTMGLMVGGEAGATAVGVAPGAKWIAAKIFNDQDVATTAAIHQSFQWLLDPDGNPTTNDAPDVVNGSWTMGAVGCDLEFQLDLRALRAAGILSVFAAGNGGSGAGTSYSPANNAEALSVGATDLTDAAAGFSSRGPSACDGSTFPDLVAPGVTVRSTDLYRSWVSKSGTSVAAPAVSGALALLLSAFPDLPADRQEAALENGAVDLGPVGADNDTGYGRLDVLAAYNWLTTAPDFSVTAPLSVTTVPGGNAPFAVTVSPVNGFTGDVALSASGLDATQATMTVVPTTVAGASGTATLSVATAASLASGSYRIAVTGTSGTTTRTTYVQLLVSPPPDFTIAASPSSASTVPGGSVSYVISVGSLNGFTGNVALSLSGLTASQAGWTFAPATVAGAGTSTLTVEPSASIAPATYALTVRGTSGTTTHTAKLNFVVVPQPDFAVSATPSSSSTLPGGSVTYTASVTAKNGFAGAVGLTLSGLTAAQASWTFTPASVTGSGTSKLAIAPAASVAPAIYRLTITGTSGGLKRATSVNLTVAQPPDFALARTPATVTVRAGKAATFAVSTTSMGGFAGNVTLTVTGVPAGATATFAPSPVATPGSSTLTVQTTRATAKGTFTLTITGASGALSRQVTARLTVR